MLHAHVFRKLSTLALPFQARSSSCSSSIGIILLKKGIFFT